MKLDGEERLIVSLLIFAIGVFFRTYARTERIKELRSEVEEIVAQENAEAEEVRALFEEDAGLCFDDDDETQLVEKPGSLTFRIPASWEDRGDTLGIFKFKDPEHSVLFNVALFEDMCLTSTSPRDVAQQVLQKLSLVSQVDSGYQEGKVGEAVWLRYPVYSEVRDNSLKLYFGDLAEEISDKDIPYRRSYGYLELLMSGHDVYYVLYLGQAGGYTREVQQEMYRIFNSIGGPEDAPLFLEDDGQESAKEDGEADDGDEESMREFLGSFGTYQSYQVEGTGNELIDIPTGAMDTRMAYPSLIELSYEGTGAIVLRCYNESDDEYHTIAERTGPYHGYVTNLGDTYATFMSRKLDVAAEGAWSITFSPMTAVEPLANGGAYEGDFISYIDEPAMSELHITHSGEGKFEVYAAGMTGSKRLVDTEGAYDETVAWDDPHTLFLVTSEGSWSISW